MLTERVVFITRFYRTLGILKVMGQMHEDGLFEAEITDGTVSWGDAFCAHDYRDTLEEAVEKVTQDLTRKVQLAKIDLEALTAIQNIPVVDLTENKSLAPVT
jgi:hypothetical protein